LAKEVARRWGVRAGVPVVGGFVDTSASILATGMRAGQLVHSVGSTEVMALCVDKPIPEEGILTRPVGVGKVFPERWLAVRTQATAGNALEWARGVMFRELNGRTWGRLLKRVTAEGKEMAAGVRCEATFTGERAAIEQAAGATFSGVRLSTTREELLGAIVRALVPWSAASYGRLARICRPLKRVYVSGGATPLAEAMHRAWSRGHVFKRVPRDNLQGLVLLVQRALNL